MLVAFDAGGSDVLAVGDLDGDQKSDLVLSAGLQLINIQRGRGDGTFDPPKSYEAAGASSIELADMDGAGRPDIVAVGFSNNIVSVLFNTCRN